MAVGRCASCEKEGVFSARWTPNTRELAWQWLNATYSGRVDWAWRSFDESNRWIFCKETPEGTSQHGPSEDYRISRGKIWEVMTKAIVNVLGRCRENVVRGTFVGLTMDGARFENLFKQRCAQDFIV